MEDFEYIEKQKQISLMQSIGSLPCKKCGGRCLPDIYIMDWVCQKCGTRYVLNTEEELDSQQRQFIEDRTNKHNDGEIIYVRDILKELLEEL